MAYKPQSDEEKEILEAYDGVKDAIIQGMMTQGMEEIKTVGETFDFKLHDCMFTEQSMEYEEDIVTRVRACVAMIWLSGFCGRTPMLISMSTDMLQRYQQEFSKGFMIGGKVIRPAKVACSTGPGP